MENAAVVLGVPHIADRVHVVVVAVRIHVSEQRVLRVLVVLMAVTDEQDADVVLHAVTGVLHVRPHAGAVRLEPVIPLCKAHVVDVLTAGDVDLAVEVVDRDGVIGQAVASCMRAVAVCKSSLALQVEVCRRADVVDRGRALHADRDALGDDLVSLVPCSVDLLIGAAGDGILFHLVERHPGDVEQVDADIRALLREGQIVDLSRLREDVVTVVAVHHLHRVRCVSDEVRDMVLPREIGLIGFDHVDIHVAVLGTDHDVLLVGLREVVVRRVDVRRREDAVKVGLHIAHRIPCGALQAVGVDIELELCIITLSVHDVDRVLL